MQTSIQDIMKRIYVHIMLTIIAFYVIIVNSITLPPSLLEALTFLVIFISGYIMYKRYPRFSTQICIVTPKDKQILELSLYAYMGVFIFQALLNQTALQGLRVFAGVLLVLINVFAIYTLYQMIKK